MKSDIEQILDELRLFNEERDWDQFHNGKDLAIGLSVEASELLECFLLKDPKEASQRQRATLRNTMNFNHAFQYSFLRICETG